MTDAPSPSDLVVRAGRAMFGDEWQRPLAVALDLNERTVRRIAQAEREGRDYPVAPGALRQLLELLNQESRKLEARARDCTRTANALNDRLVTAARAKAP